MKNIILYSTLIVSQLLFSAMAYGGRETGNGPVVTECLALAGVQLTDELRHDACEYANFGRTSPEMDRLWSLMEYSDDPQCMNLSLRDIAAVISDGALVCVDES